MVRRSGPDRQLKREHERTHGHEQEAFQLVPPDVEEGAGGRAWRNRPGCGRPEDGTLGVVDEEAAAVAAADLHLPGGDWAAIGHGLLGHHHAL